MLYCSSNASPWATVTTTTSAATSRWSLPASTWCPDTEPSRSHSTSAPTCPSRRTYLPQYRQWRPNYELVWSWDIVDNYALVNLNLQHRLKWSSSHYLRTNGSWESVPPSYPATCQTSANRSRCTTCHSTSNALWDGSENNSLPYSPLDSSFFLLNIGVFGHQSGPLRVPARVGICEQFRRWRSESERVVGEGFNGEERRIRLLNHGSHIRVSQSALTVLYNCIQCYKG